MEPSLKSKSSATLAVLSVVGASCFAGLALARAGGGESYSAPSSGSGDAGGGDFVGTLIFDLVRVLFRITWDYPIVGIPLDIIALVCFFSFYRSRSNVWRNAPAAPIPATRSTNVDHKDQFTTRVEYCFLTVQRAWTARDLRRIRAFVSDGVQERLETLLEIQERCGYHNQTESVSIKSITVLDSTQDAHFETVQVRIDAFAIDFDERVRDGTLAAGTRATLPFTEYWSFLRRPSAPGTQRQTGGVDTCPACGAKLVITDRASCEHCQTLVNSGAYDWVVSEISQNGAGGLTAHQPPGVAELTARDPAFNAQYAEDRAAVAFWRLRIAELRGQPQSAESIALGTFVKSQSRRYARGLDGKTGFFVAPAVGSVTLLAAVSGDPDHPRTTPDRLYFRVRWSGREVRARLPAEILRRDGTLMPFDETFVLCRDADVLSSTARGLSSRCCAACGAPETRSHGAICRSCGTELASGRLDWIIEDVRIFHADDIPEVVPGPTPDDVIGAFASVVLADGVLRKEERENLIGFATQRGMGREHVERILESIAERRLPRVRFATKTQAKAFMDALRALALADGELAPEERALIERIGKHLGIDPGFEQVPKQAS